MTCTQACETPMSDHVARFWQTISSEHVRILIDIRRDHDEGQPPHWDSASFSNEVAKALVADHQSTTLAQAGWMPIETAPRDEDLLLGWWQEWPERRWECAAGLAGSTRGGWLHGQATHWQRLPGPPGAAQPQAAPVEALSPEQWVDKLREGTEFAETPLTRCSAGTDAARCPTCGWGGGGIRDEGCLISPCPRHVTTQPQAVLDRDQLAQTVCDALWGPRDISFRNDDVKEAGYRVADALTAALSRPQGNTP
jgi:hypothetical protein